jgi:hypothetical protein
LEINALKIHQKFLKIPLHAAAAMLPFAHRKIVLGGTTARRTIRLRRAVSFWAFDRFGVIAAGFPPIAA